MERALREITTIPGVRMNTFPNYVRQPNERGGYDAFELPPVLIQEEWIEKYPELADEDDN